MAFSISVEHLLTAAVGLLVLLLLAAIGAIRTQLRTRQRLLQAQGQLLARIEEQDRAQERSERAVREEFAKNREEAGGAGKLLREEILASIQGVRGTVDSHLDRLRQENSQKLDAMRQTVDEKLQGTLEKRLGESFRQVSERLEAVHQGLGEMQSLAVGVGDLRKVLTNVRARGAFGEVQLETLLEQILAPEQYERQRATRPGGNERVDFAIRMPGPGGDGDPPVWLPIDAKFPHEDYERLVDAQERGDTQGAEQASRALETRVRSEARSIREKYVSPPHTTDFALLFLPTEALYAEVLRRPGLLESLQREFRVGVTGPTTLAALLNSLQMGFRTLAIQKRSDEVWQLLGAVRTQFGKFGELLEKVDKKLHEASNTIGHATRKSRYIERRLGRVDALGEGEAQELLPELGGPAGGADPGDREAGS